MRYLSVCSGIESVLVAWHPLGWQAAMFKIDLFCDQSCSKFEWSRRIFPDHRGNSASSDSRIDETPHNTPLVFVTRCLSLAWQGCENAAAHPSSQQTRSALWREAWRERRSRSTPGKLYRRSKGPATLQTGVSAGRHLSRIFPAYPRSLASALLPRPAARRCSASPSRAPSGSGFPRKNLPAATALTGEIFPRSLHRKHISALGVGRLASLRARVSRGQYGQIQTGEMQWHSTKTRSL
jgi:hypothetical protein